MPLIQSRITPKKLSPVRMDGPGNQRNASQNVGWALLPDQHKTGKRAHPTGAVVLLMGCVFVLSMAGCAPSPRSSSPGPEDPDAPKEFTVTDSGLKYRILRRGNGEKPKPASFVTVDYSGWLDSGREFDTSYGRREPTSFNLQNVVPGWTEGLQLIDEGGMIELEIPSDLGYGPAGMPGSIPPNATLHFKVELHDVRGG